MKSLAEFTDYYNQALKSDIERLETKRLRVTRIISYKAAFRLILFLLVLAVAVMISKSLSPEVSAFFKSSSSMLVKSNPLVTVFLLSLALLLFVAIARSIAFNPIARKYQHKIIPKVLSFVDSSLSYQPGKGIAEQEFTDGGLFSARPGMSFSSQDLIEGTIENIKVRLSNLKVTDEEADEEVSANPSRDSDETERIRTKRINVFIGLYAICQRKGNESQSKQSQSNDFGKPSGVVRKEVNDSVHVAYFDNQVHVAFKGTKIFDAGSHLSFLEPDITKKSFSCIEYVMGVAGATN